MFAFPAGSQCLPSSASLQMVSDCCQRGPICSRGSQLANSSVCTRSIVVLTKVTRLRVSLPPTQLRLLSLLSFPLGWNLFFFYLFFWSRDSLSPSLMLRRAEAIFVSWSRPPTSIRLITLSFLRTAACFPSRTLAYLPFLGIRAIARQILWGKGDQYSAMLGVPWSRRGCRDSNVSLFFSLSSASSA